jgi:hypothetical protein
LQPGQQGGYVGPQPLPVALVIAGAVVSPWVVPNAKGAHPGIPED